MKSVHVVAVRNTRSVVGGVIKLRNYQTHAVYDQNLWIAVRECGQNKVVASGIAELDADIKEGILEWIQVSPEYRGKRLGKFVVNELLWRMKDKAEFVTISGKLDNPTNPRELYLACDEKVNIL